jgi:hypothetical protein
MSAAARPRSRALAHLRKGVVLLGAPCLACGSVDRTCTETGTEPSEPTLRRSADGSYTLSQGAREARVFEVQLSHLPEVWLAANTVYGPWLVATVTLSYAAAAPTNAELPVVSLGLSNDQSRSQPSLYTSGPPPQGTVGGFTSTASVSIQPFRVCSWDGEEECCAFGSESCSGSVVLELSRSDALFPDVVASWDVEVSASVRTCLGNEDEPTLALTEPK